MEKEITRTRLTFRERLVVLEELEKVCDAVEGGCRYKPGWSDDILARNLAAKIPLVSRPHVAYVRTETLGQLVREPKTNKVAAGGLYALGLRVERLEKDLQSVMSWATRKGFSPD